MSETKPEPGKNVWFITEGVNSASPREQPADAEIERLRQGAHEQCPCVLGGDDGCQHEDGCNLCPASHTSIDALAACAQKRIAELIEENRGARKHLTALKKRRADELQRLRLWKQRYKSTKGSLTEQAERLEAEIASERRWRAQDADEASVRIAELERERDEARKLHDEHCRTDPRSGRPELRASCSPPWSPPDAHRSDR